MPVTTKLSLFKSPAYRHQRHRLSQNCDRRNQVQTIINFEIWGVETNIIISGVRVIKTSLKIDDTDYQIRKKSVSISSKARSSDIVVSEQPTAPWSI